MQNKPQYSIASVDHALRLAVALSQEGPLSVTQAAAFLGVARSTAHRLLAVLVYRDFAEQLPDRRYGPGPVLRRDQPAHPVEAIRAVAVPHLRTLVDRVGESANVMILDGTEIQMVATVECGQALRVGDRAGKRLPAHLASGGRALLAGMSRAELEMRYTAAGTADVELDEVLRIVRQTRRRGFAINDEGTETGLTAIGHPVGDRRIPPIALSLAMPTARYRRTELPALASALAETAAAIDHELK